MTDLTICPREDCTATYRHWHSRRGAVRVCGFLPGSCGHEDPPGVAEACHEPRPQADLTEPVDLPTVEELASLIWSVSRRDEGTISATGADHVAEAALDLIRERLTPVEWQPIDFADIKPGMRVRRDCDGTTTIQVAEADLVDGQSFGRWMRIAYMSRRAIWHADPRTIPAEPEDPRVERVAQALYEAGRDSTRPGWQDVTDKTRGKHLKRARAAVAAIDEAVES